MSIVVLKLPDVKSEVEGRPERCPSCKGETFQRWGGQWRKIRDPQVRYVLVYRYRCCHCRHTFRYYPGGVDQARQSQRLRKLAALMRVMGLSYRGIAALLPVFGAGIGRMSAWRDEQVWAEQLRQQRKWKPVRVLGVDEAYVRAFGAVRPVLVAVDVGAGHPVAIGYVDEYNPDAVRRWLEPLVKRLGGVSSSPMTRCITRPWRRSWTSKTKSANFMYGVGWDARSKSYKPACLPHGWRCSPKSDNCCMTCLIQARGDYFSCGNRSMCPVQPGMNRARRWINCAIC